MTRKEQPTSTGPLMGCRVPVKLFLNPRVTITQACYGPWLMATARVADVKSDLMAVLVAVALICHEFFFAGSPSWIRLA